MTPAVAASVRQSGACSVVTNNTFQLAPWADMLIANDTAWWIRHSQTALAFAGLKVTAHDSVPFRQVLSLRNSGKEGFDPDPAAVRTGGNSGYTAIHVAAHAAAARILLCGFDMRPGHWHGDHPQGLRNAEAHTYRNWVRRFATLAASLQQRGIEVLNCTPRSALQCFPMANLEETLAPCAAH